MGRLLACMISRGDLLGRALLEERDALGYIETGDGFGAGFYQAGEVLHRKRPRLVKQRLDWAGMLDGVNSHVAIAHVREATSGERRAEDTHPFRMRQWLFAHVGELTGHTAIREPLLGALPDFLRRNIRGSTDSELLFHVLLSFLHDGSQLETFDVSEGAVAAALRSTLTLVDRHSQEVGAPVPTLTMALTNGRQLYALVRGAPLIYTARDRLHRRDSDGPTGKGSDQVRYVFIASPASDEIPTGYTQLKDAELISVDRDLKLTIQKL